MVVRRLRAVLVGAGVLVGMTVVMRRVVVGMAEGATRSVGAALRLERCLHLLERRP